MINAGAITVHSLVAEAGSGPAERVRRVLDGLSAFAGRRLEMDEKVCASEMEHAHRNLAIAHMLRSHDILTEDAGAVVDGYTRQCSVLVTTRDLAMMAATLANHGVNPLSGDQVVPEGVVRQVLSVMFSCGMYDAAGDWTTQVGIPAKSGVAGGLIGALPGRLGIATFSPRLDSHGNSVRGVSLFERFSSDMGLHVMEVPPRGGRSCGPATSSAADRTRSAFWNSRAASTSREPSVWCGRSWTPIRRRRGWPSTSPGSTRSTTWHGAWCWRSHVG